MLPTKKSGSQRYSFAAANIIHPPKRPPQESKSQVGGLISGVSCVGFRSQPKGQTGSGGGGIWGVVVWGKNPPQPTSGCLASLGDQEWRTFNQKKQPDHHPQAASPASTTTAIGKAGGNPGPLMPRLLKIATRPLSAPSVKGGGDKNFSSRMLEPSASTIIKPDCCTPNRVLF